MGFDLSLNCWFNQPREQGLAAEVFRGLFGVEIGGYTFVIKAVRG